MYNQTGGLEECKPALPLVILNKQVCTDKNIWWGSKTRPWTPELHCEGRKSAAEHVRIININLIFPFVKQIFEYMETAYPVLKTVLPDQLVVCSVIPCGFAGIFK